MCMSIKINLPQDHKWTLVDRGAYLELLSEGERCECDSCKFYEGAIRDTLAHLKNNRANYKTHKKIAHKVIHKTPSK